MKALRYLNHLPKRQPDPEMVKKMKDFEQALEFVELLIEDYDEPCYDLLDWQVEALQTVVTRLQLLETYVQMVAQGISLGGVDGWTMICRTVDDWRSTKEGT